MHTPLILIFFLILGCVFWFACILVVAHRILRLKLHEEYSVIECILLTLIAPSTVLAEYAMDTYVILENERVKRGVHKSKTE